MDYVKKKIEEIAALRSAERDSSFSLSSKNNQQQAEARWRINRLEDEWYRLFLDRVDTLLPLTNKEIQKFGVEIEIGDCSHSAPDGVVCSASVVLKKIRRSCLEYCQEYEAFVCDDEMFKIGKRFDAYAPVVMMPIGDLNDESIDKIIGDIIFYELGVNLESFPVY